MSSYIANTLGIMFDYVEANSLLCSLIDENGLSDNSEQLIIALLNLLSIEIPDERKSYYKSWEIKALMWVLIYSYLTTCDKVLSKISQGIDINFSEIKMIYKSQFLKGCEINCVNFQNSNIS